MRRFVIRRWSSNYLRWASEKALRVKHCSQLYSEQLILTVRLSTSFIIVLDCIKAYKNDASGTLSVIGVRWTEAFRLTKNLKPHFDQPSGITDFAAKVINTDNSLYQIVP